MSDKPKTALKPDSVKVLINFDKLHTTPDTWEFAVKNAQELTNKWLKLRAKIDFLDVMYRAVPMPVYATFATYIGQAQFLR